MNKRIAEALADLRDRQAVGEWMPCPRCGRDTMKLKLHTNGVDAGERMATPNAEDDRSGRVLVLMPKSENGTEVIFNLGEPFEHVKKPVLGEKTADDSVNQFLHGDVLSGQLPCRFQSAARSAFPRAQQLDGHTLFSSLLLNFSRAA